MDHIKGQLDDFFDSVRNDIFQIMKTIQISNSAIWRHISVQCFQSEG